MSAARAVECVPAAREHWPFVLDSFRAQMKRAAVVGSAVGDHVALLERDMRGLGRVIVATPIGHPESYLGWAAESFGSLVFAYVPRALRGFGFANAMVAELFRCGPIRLVYWTDTAEEIREHGFPLVHDWREFARRQQAAAGRPMRIHHHHQERAA